MLGCQACFVSPAIFLVSLIQQKLSFGSFRGGAVAFGICISAVTFCLLHSGMDGCRVAR